MLISGIQKFTMLDYPGKSACIVFTPGCNFRCGYCHNPEFVLPERIAELKSSFIPEEAFMNFLEQRKGLLEGVVVTGGEPTLMPDLLDFMKKIKELGFLVKLDSNGNRPEVLKKALEQKIVDYIAMDVKTSLDEYARLVGKLVKPENIAESIKLIMDSGLEYEFRSTIVKETHLPETLKAMAKLISGSTNFYLQNFRAANTLSPEFQRYHSFTNQEMEEIADLFRTQVKNVAIRI